jgi:hypothetical protein
MALAVLTTSFTKLDVHAAAATADGDVDENGAEAEDAEALQMQMYVDKFLSPSLFGGLSLYISQYLAPQWTAAPARARAGMNRRRAEAALVSWSMTTLIRSPQEKWPSGYIISIYTSIH